MNITAQDRKNYNNGYNYRVTIEDENSVMDYYTITKPSLTEIKVKKKDYNIAGTHKIVDLQKKFENEKPVKIERKKTMNKLEQLREVKKNLESNKIFLYVGKNAVYVDEWNSTRGKVEINFRNITPSGNLGKKGFADIENLADLVPIKGTENISISITDRAVKTAMQEALKYGNGDATPAKTSTARPAARKAAKSTERKVQSASTSKKRMTRSAAKLLFKEYYKNVVDTDKNEVNHSKRNDEILAELNEENYSVRNTIDRQMWIFDDEEEHPIIKRDFPYSFFENEKTGYKPAAKTSTARPAARKAAKTDTKTAKVVFIALVDLKKVVAGELVKKLNSKRGRVKFIHPTNKEEVTKTALLETVFSKRVEASRYIASKGKIASKNATKANAKTTARVARKTIEVMTCGHCSKLVKKGKTWECPAYETNYPDEKICDQFEAKK